MCLIQASLSCHVMKLFLNVKKHSDLNTSRKCDVCFLRIIVTCLKFNWCLSGHKPMDHTPLTFGTLFSYLISRFATKLLTLHILVART